MSEGHAADLDETIHGRLRLGIMAYLSAVESATFAELKAKTGASDGNLSVHLRKLEEAGYVEIAKRFVDRRPQTRVRLSEDGRKAWRAYLGQLAEVLKGGA